MTDVTASDFTDEERATLRTAAFGSIVIVAQADPGFIDALKESVAGSKALGTAPPALQELLRKGGLPPIPTGDRVHVEQAVLDAVHRSVVILRTKAPSWLPDFRAVVEEAIQRTANAADGVVATETALIDRIRVALAD